MLDVIKLPIRQACIELGLSKMRLSLLHHHEILGRFLPPSLIQIETSQLKSSFGINRAAVFLRKKPQGIFKINRARWVAIGGQLSFPKNFKSLRRESCRLLRHIFSRKRKTLLHFLKK